MKILALDLGKFNTMCCFFDTKTRKHSFLNATTDREYLSKVFKANKIELRLLQAHYRTCSPSLIASQSKATHTTAAWAS